MTDDAKIERVAKTLYYAEMCNEGMLLNMLVPAPAYSWRMAASERRRGFRDLARAALAAMKPCPTPRAR